MTGSPHPNLLTESTREAFLRRLDFVIDFPFPEAEDRSRIWRLVLPDEAPLADDVGPPDEGEVDRTPETETDTDTDTETGQERRD